MSVPYIFFHAHLEPQLEGAKIFKLDRKYSSGKSSDKINNLSN